jgi:para-nitrobenzyl esterase
MLKSLFVIVGRTRRVLAPVTLAVPLFACDAPDGDLPTGTQGSSETAGAQGSANAAGAQGGSAASGSPKRLNPPVTCSVGSSSDPLVIPTATGLVKGTHGSGGGFAFLGIPFAKPPTGSLRFMPPEPAGCWSNVVDATHYGNTCAQFNGIPIGSEDCLNLNVWVPALPSSSTKPRPVLVWMYGGGNFAGGTNFGLSEFGFGESIYDGQALANAQNAVVVSFNYRVGVLGFLAHPALRAANASNTTGNNGLLDAITALQWVQDNIAAFGGDKTHVMLFGQSAGAFNTCSLVASPLAKGLFSSALMESGNCAAEQLPYQYKFGAGVVALAGCAKAPDVVSCLQHAPLGPLVEFSGIDFLATYAGQLAGHIDPKHSQALPFGPTVDGFVLDDVPLATIRAGKHNHVPLLIGTNTQEVNFVADPLVVVGCAGADALAHYWFPTVGTQMLKAYPCNPLASIFDPLLPARAIGQLPTDAIFTCPSRRAARAASISQTEPVYRYVWSHVTPYLGLAELVGAFHGSEMPYVFGTFGSVLYEPTHAERALSQQIQTYWANFAATGNPNGPGLPTWSEYDPTADNALRLDTPIGSISAFEQRGCDFWDTVQ